VVTQVLSDLREKLEPFYREMGRPSIDPELMIRMVIVGYCYGIRFERSSATKSTCIWLIDGSAGSMSTSGSLHAE
jgi:hypothetical protein